MFGEDKMLGLYSEIEELLKHDEMVSIFRLEDCGGQSDLDLAILRALLKANTGRYVWSASVLMNSESR